MTALEGRLRRAKADVNRLWAYALSLNTQKSKDSIAIKLTFAKFRFTIFGEEIQMEPAEARIAELLSLSLKGNILDWGDDTGQEGGTCKSHPSPHTWRCEICLSICVPLNGKDSQNSSLKGSGTNVPESLKAANFPEPRWETFHLPFPPHHPEISI
jgi:hypothetical protein